MKTPLFSIILTFIITCSLLAQQDSTLTDKAWAAFHKGEVAKVENLFLQAIDENPQNVRPYFGLSQFYETRGKYFQAYETFIKAMEYIDNPAPYYFVERVLLKYSDLQKIHKSESLNFYEAMIEHTDKLKILEALGNEYIAELYLELGNYKKAEMYFSKFQSISQWNLIGPFDNISASGFDKVYEPEKEYDIEKTYYGKNGAPAHWFPVKKVSRSKWIFLTNYFGSQQAVYYAATFVYIPEKTDVYFRIGTSGSLKTFLNDELIINVPDEGNNDLDTYIVQTELQKGWNKILLKLGHSEIKHCNFLLRVTDTTGTPLIPDKISTDAQPYLARPNAATKQIPHFAEEFFRQQIIANPGHPENYLFLANTYLRNDKGVLAELVIKQVLKLFPKNTAFLEKLLDAYSRSEKWNEYSTTINQIIKIDRTMPLTLKYTIGKDIENDNLDAAEKNIAILSQSLPESALYYNMIISYYSQKGQLDEIKKYVDAAYEKYPYMWKFTEYKILLAEKADKDVPKAIELNKDFLDKYKEESALTKLLGLYFRTGNNTEALKVFEKIFKHLPADPYYYYQLGNIYSAMGDYSRAEEYAEQALEIRPGESAFLEQLGDIARMDGRKDEASSHYSKALAYRPTNYDARSKLRDLQKLPDIFDIFPKIDIDSLQFISPSADEYPDDNFNVMLHYKRRVVYENGGSETLREYMVKVFNNDGVDQLKHYSLGFNPYLEKLIIEKAVVYKEDGAEINADINENEIVFKSLEPGNSIYIKWKKRSYSWGKLAGHFWDDFHFSGYVPIENAIYAIYTEGNKDFKYTTRNSKIVPKKIAKANGQIHLWEVKKAARIEYESNMPGYTEAAQGLYISSIPDWNYIANWYRDLALAKAKPTHEIKELVNQLFSGKENLDTMQKVKIVYNYITENIRYSSVAFRQSNLIPQKARDVLSAKIGDCKDKTTLFIAMMNELGIDAHYVLVNTDEKNPGLEILPTIGFDHVIAVVTIDSADYYYDLTAYNYPANTLPSMDNGAFALKISAETEQPFFIPERDIIDNILSRNSRFTFLPGEKIEAQIITERSGKVAAGFRATYRNEGQTDREKILLNTIGGEFRNINLSAFTTDDLDTLTTKLSYYYKFKASGFATEAGNLSIFKIPWTDGFELDESFSLQQRKYPIWLGDNSLIRKEKMTIHLPDDLKPVELPKTVHYKTLFGEYKVSYSFVPGSLKAERYFISTKQRITAKEYQDFKTFYLNMVKNDDRQLVFKKSQYGANSD